MTPTFKGWDLDGEVVFDRCLGTTDDLDVIQSFMATVTPRWSSKLRVWRGSRDQRPVDVVSRGALHAAVMTAVQERGSTYRGLVRRHGTPSDERVTGSVELRGAGPELTVVISVDERVLSPLGAKKTFGNHVALQVRRPGVEGGPGSVWLNAAFKALCAQLAPAWGWAGHPGEYWAKAMSDPPGASAIGRDFARFLPGVFWLNFFGRTAVEFIGMDRIRSTPVGRLDLVDGGVLLDIDEDPSLWETPDYERQVRSVTEHLGSDLFFSKLDPDRPTRTLEWGM